MLSFLPTLLRRSCSLLMQIPTRRTFGFTDHEIWRSLIQFDGACYSGLPWKCLSQSLYKDELWLYTSGVIHLHLWRAVQFRARSHASADPCQNSLQAGSCIIFLWLSKKQRDIVIICVSQCEEPSYISVHHENLFHKLWTQTFPSPRIRLFFYALLHKYFLLHVCLLSENISLPFNWILNYCIHRVPLTWMDCVHQS